MKNHLFLLSLISCFLIGCNNDAEKISEQVLEKQTDALVPIEPESIDTILEDKIIFIEDYSAFKTRDEAKSALGKDNMTEESAFYEEGTIELKQLIYTNPKNKDVIIFILEEGDENAIASLEVNHTIWNKEYEVDHTQKIKSKYGFYTGMELQELEKLNGAPINFAGFGWDFEGSIMNLNGGSLEGCKTSFRFGLTDYSDVSPDIMGDRELNSDMKVAQAAGIIIEEITVDQN